MTTRDEAVDEILGMTCPADGCGERIYKIVEEDLPKDLAPDHKLADQLDHPVVYCEDGHASGIEWVRQDQDQRLRPVLVWSGIRFPGEAASESHA